MDQTESYRLMGLVLNSVWACLSLLVAVYMAALWLRTESGAVKTLSAGIGLVSAGSFCHRTFWLLAIAFAVPGELYAQGFLENRWLLILFVVAIGIGYAMHIKTALKDYCPYWWAVPLCAALIGAVLGSSIYIIA